jgi:hypothetical protein
VKSKDLVIGEEYGIRLEGQDARARLVRIDNWSGHSMEITKCPEKVKINRWGQPMFSIGDRIGVHSVSVKYPMSIVIHEEEDEPAWA